MKTALLKLLKFATALALVLTVCDVNTSTCFGPYHQPQLPKAAEKLKMR